MSSPTSSHGRALASIVTVAGVVAIWAFSAYRQQDQTETLARQWVGEQWDIARACLVGTPIGRGEGEAEIAARLEARLLESLALASESAEPVDPEAMWPARCVPILSSLRVDPSVLRADPGDAVTTLEVLLPRVLRRGPEGPSELALGDAAERARELAGFIALLDEAMPSGAEYDPTDYADAEAGPARAVVRSMACEHRAPAQRPFLRGRVGESILVDELETEERSLRLTGEGERGPYRIATADAEGTRMRVLADDGRRHPRFWDETTLVWLSAEGAETRAAMGPIEGPPLRNVTIGGSPETLALCRPDADGRNQIAHLIVGSDERARWVRWAFDDEASERGDAREGISIRPRPPDAGSRVACSASSLAIAWPDETEWAVVLCSGRACRALPRLRGGGDLQLGFVDDVLVVVARGRRTDLRLARRWTGAPRSGSWSEPVVVPRGTLRTARADASARAALVLDACGEARVESRDGARWTLTDEHRRGP